MKWMLLIRPRAEADLVKARQWYDEQRIGLGDEFLSEVVVALNRITEDPHRPLIYYRGFRRVLVQRFPYKVFYRVEENYVIVFRVLHGRRDHRQGFSGEK
jgi:plasmid stabilization system protein ParE